MITTAFKCSDFARSRCATSPALEEATYHTGRGCLNRNQDKPTIAQPGQVPILRKTARVLFESQPSCCMATERRPAGREGCRATQWLSALNSIEPFVMNVAVSIYLCDEEWAKPSRGRRVRPERLVRPLQIARRQPI